MGRTHIYLTEAEHDGLRTLSRNTGKTVGELIRTAVDELLQPSTPDDRLALLRDARGIWQNKTDLPDFAALRREGDVRLAPSRHG